MWNPFRRRLTDIHADNVLAVLDRCCKTFQFPVFDNGYIYPAASRLSLFRSPADWAIVIEIFGYSPRAGDPDTSIYTFGSRVVHHKEPRSFANQLAFDQYVARHPDSDVRSVFPIEREHWQDVECDEYVASDAISVNARGRIIPIPSLSEYPRYGIDLENAGQLRVFELCRYLAHVARDEVLATPGERRRSVPTQLEQLLVIEEWNHPDVIGKSELPSTSESFQQLAEVLSTSDTGRYRPTKGPNTHWRNWPEAGTL